MALVRKTAFRVIIPTIIDRVCQSLGAEDLEYNGVYKESLTSLKNCSKLLLDEVISRLVEKYGIFFKQDNICFNVFSSAEKWCVAIVQLIKLTRLCLESHRLHQLKESNADTSSPSSNNSNSNQYYQQDWLREDLGKALFRFFKLALNASCDDSPLVLMLPASKTTSLLDELSSEGVEAIKELSGSSIRAMTSVILFSLEYLKNSSHEEAQSDLRDLCAIEYCEFTEEALVKFLCYVSDHIKEFKKPVLQYFAETLFKPIWNWIKSKPEEFVKLYKRNGIFVDTLPNLFAAIYDLAESSSRRKGRYIRTLTTILLLCPETLLRVVRGESSKSINKESKFLDNLKKAIKSKMASTVEAAILSLADICKASILINSCDFSPLRLMAPEIESELKEKLFDMDAPYMRPDFTVDVELLVDCLKSIYHLNPRKTAKFLFPTLMELYCHPAYKAVMMETCISIISEKSTMAHLNYDFADSYPYICDSLRSLLIYVSGNLSGSGSSSDSNQNTSSLIFFKDYIASINTGNAIFGSGTSGNSGGTNTSASNNINGISIGNLVSLVPADKKWMKKILTADANHIQSQEELAIIVLRLFSLDPHLAVAGSAKQLKTFDLNFELIVQTCRLLDLAMNYFDTLDKNLNASSPLGSNANLSASASSNNSSSNLNLNQLSLTERKNRRHSHFEIRKAAINFIIRLHEPSVIENWGPGGHSVVSCFWRGSSYLVVRLSRLIRELFVMCIGRDAKKDPIPSNTSSSNTANEDNGMSRRLVKFQTVKSVLKSLISLLHNRNAFLAKQRESFNAFVAEMRSTGASLENLENALLCRDLLVDLKNGTTTGKLTSFAAEISACRNGALLELEITLLSLLSSHDPDIVHLAVKGISHILEECKILGLKQQTQASTASSSNINISTSSSNTLNTRKREDSFLANWNVYEEICRMAGMSSSKNSLVVQGDEEGSKIADGSFLDESVGVVEGSHNLSSSRVIRSQLAKMIIPTEGCARAWLLIESKWKSVFNRNELLSLVNYLVSSHRLPLNLDDNDFFSSLQQVVGESEDFDVNSNNSASSSSLIRRLGFSRLARKQQKSSEGSVSASCAATTSTGTTGINSSDATSGKDRSDSFTLVTKDGSSSSGEAVVNRFGSMKKRGGDVVIKEGSSKYNNNNSGGGVGKIEENSPPLSNSSSSSSINNQVAALSNDLFQDLFLEWQSYTFFLCALGNITSNFIEVGSKRTGLVSNNPNNPNNNNNNSGTMKTSASASSLNNNNNAAGAGANESSSVMSCSPLEIMLISEFEGFCDSLSNLLVLDPSETNTSSSSNIKSKGNSNSNLNSVSSDFSGVPAVIISRSCAVVRQVVRHVLQHNAVCTNRAVCIVTLGKLQSLEVPSSSSQSSSSATTPDNNKSAAPPLIISSNIDRMQMSLNIRLEQTVYLLFSALSNERANDNLMAQFDFSSFIGQCATYLELDRHVMPTTALASHSHQSFSLQKKHVESSASTSNAANSSSSSSSANCKDSAGDVVRLKLLFTQLTLLVVHFFKKGRISLRQEIAIKNLVLEAIVRWITLATTTNASIKKATINTATGNSGSIRLVRLDVLEFNLALIKTASALLSNLPLQPNTFKGKNLFEDVSEVKERLFKNYFDRFVATLNRCKVEIKQQLAQLQEDKSVINAAGDHVHHGQKGKNSILQASQRLFQELREGTVQAISNLLSANVEYGLKFTLMMGYDEDSKMRTEFMKVLTNVLEQGMQLDELLQASQSLSIGERYQKLVDLLLFNGESSSSREETSHKATTNSTAASIDNYPILKSLFNVCPASEMDGVASTLYGIFKAKGKLFILFKLAIEHEVGQTEFAPTLFRRNSICTKLLTLFTAKSPNSRTFLEACLGEAMQKMTLLATGSSYPYCPFEVDPLKLKMSLSSASTGVEDDAERIQIIRTENMKRLEELCALFTERILSTRVPRDYRLICTFLFQACKDKFTPSVHQSSSDYEDEDNIGGDVSMKLDSNNNGLADEKVEAEKIGIQIALNAVAGFIFLRFVSPAIVTPESYSYLIPYLTPPTSSSESSNTSSKGRDFKRRTLLLVSKVIQNMANNVQFGLKEEFMRDLNHLLAEMLPRVSNYLRNISSLSLISSNEGEEDNSTSNVNNSNNGINNNGVKSANSSNSSSSSSLNNNLNDEDEEDAEKSYHEACLKLHYYLASNSERILELVNNNVNSSNTSAGGGDQQPTDNLTTTNSGSAVNSSSSSALVLYNQMALLLARLEPVPELARIPRILAAQHDKKEKTITSNSSAAVESSTNNAEIKGESSIRSPLFSSSSRLNGSNSGTIGSGKNAASSTSTSTTTSSLNSVFRDFIRRNEKNDIGNSSSIGGNNNDSDSNVDYEQMGIFYEHGTSRAACVCAA